MSFKNQQGFSLVELMVVVAIIGILSAIAVPRFSIFRARAQQAEAKSVLNGVYLSMESFRANAGNFPNVVAGTLATAAGIGFNVDGVQRYEYRLTSTPAAVGGRDSWAATAASLRLITSPANTTTGCRDVVRINVRKNVCNMYDAINGAGMAAAACDNVAGACVTAVATAVNPTLVTTTGGIDDPGA